MGHVVNVRTFYKRGLHLQEFDFVGAADGLPEPESAACSSLCELAWPDPGDEQLVRNALEIAMRRSAFASQSRASYSAEAASNLISEAYDTGFRSCDELAQHAVRHLLFGAHPACMELSHVVFLCKLLQQAGLTFWIDGGWGVDALFGQQSRAHSDLDIAAKSDDLPAFAEYLRGATYLRHPSEEEGPWNMVFGDGDGHYVDLRGFRLDGEGNGIVGNGRMNYSASALNGSGVLANMLVRCIASRGGNL